jgi:DMSO/TMAO reductase YedYZ molybdopterin-dependent catalytic subunit
MADQPDADQARAGEPRPRAGDGDGAPVGRRTVLGLLALGAVGVVTGHSVQDGLAHILAPIQQHDPTGLTGLIPLGDTFRFYSVTGSVPRPSATSYRLGVSGLVAHPASYTLSDLQAMPQTSFVRDFQCVTGWRVPQVHWAGVQLSELLDRAGPVGTAKAVRFRSFDGTYTESLPLAAARRADVIVALQMLGAPVTHDHGGPVRIYAAEMYGYKSTKWLSGIELTNAEIPGYWETRGYDLNGFIKQ